MNGINLKRFIIVIITVIAVLYIGMYRLKIDTDIVGSLPTNDPVLSDCRYVILNHPIQDQMVIDIGIEKDDPDFLVDAAKYIENRLEQSGLFESVGMKGAFALIPELIFHIVDNLPVMFTHSDLNTQVQELLEPARIRKKIEENIQTLMNIDGIGQSELIAKDPLGLRNIVMARLSHLAPSKHAIIYQGYLMSEDKRHILITAVPKGSGTDTVFSRKIRDLILDINYAVSLTPVGAYRAALDNEEIAKRDTKRAILFSTLGIAILLIAAFPRPFLGLLSLVPAIVGTAGALFVYSIFRSSISIMTIGFGGAIISITVDHGIAYLLFLDRPHETFGKKAAEEVRAVGLLAALTTIGAFLTLSISGFPILAQIGLFSALGVAISFIFVHTVFPGIFPVMPAAKTQRKLFLQNIADWLALSGCRYKAYAALLLAIIMLPFAAPEFCGDFRSMNTVSSETRAAENAVAERWGNILSKIFMVIEGNTVDELLENTDKAAEILEIQTRSGIISPAFIVSMIFPGKIRSEKNLAAWNLFWDDEKKFKVQQEIERVGQDMGFSQDAFANFFRIINDKKEMLNDECRMMKEKEFHHSSFITHHSSFHLMGISKKQDKWTAFCTLNSGRLYNAEAFYSVFSRIEGVKIFDPAYFSVRLGDFLFKTFIKMAVIIGISVIILVSVFLLDLRLTIIAFLPIIFALICTMGTLNLIGHPLDIPGLMITIVVIGMGIDYSIFFVMSHRRYNDPCHPSSGLVRTAVLLASSSTLIGFGVLCFADHALLKSAGITSFLGIGYALLGTFAILPSILKKHY